MIKTKQGSRKYCIIIRGPLGIGKSTISKMLAKRLNAKYVSLDKILQDHKLDKVSKKQGCIPAKNFLKANNLILSKIQKDIKNNKIIIFDGCFYHKEQIKHLKRNLPSKKYIFNLKAPLKVCILRDSKRKRVYGPGAAQAVYGLVSRFDYGTNINTKNQTPIQTLNKILTKLPKLK